MNHPENITLSEDEDHAGNPWIWASCPVCHCRVGSIILDNPRSMVARHVIHDLTHLDCNYPRTTNMWLKGPPTSPNE